MHCDNQGGSIAFRSSLQPSKVGTGESGIQTNKQNHARSKNLGNHQLLNNIYLFQKIVIKNLDGYYKKMDKFGVAVGAWAVQKELGIARYFIQMNNFEYVDKQRLLLSGVRSVIQRLNLKMQD